MAFCNKCGQQIDDNVQTCPNCGAPNGAAGNAQNYLNNFTNKAPNSRFARFHANQGLVLFILVAIAGAVAGVICLIPFVWIIGGILSAAVSIFGLVLSILGIVNAANGQAKQLPLIGGITLLK